MAEIVFGFGTSHGPLLATPPHEWDLRANVDRKNKALAFGAGTYDFQQLYQLRKDEHFEKQNTIEVRRERDARCQHQLDTLGEQLARVNPDVLIIVGDDHHEWFLNDIQPAFSIFHGKEIFNRALTPQEEQQKIANGGAYAMKIYHPPRDEIYPCPSELAAHVVTRTVKDEFDTTALGEQPHDAGVPRQLGHPYGFIYRRILKSRPIPLIPILVNTYYPPNQPTAKRCLEFGRAVARAVKEWPGKERVAVVASGGVSHFVIDEAFDWRLLNALNDARSTRRWLRSPRSISVPARRRPRTGSSSSPGCCRMRISRWSFSTMCRAIVPRPVPAAGWHWRAGSERMQT